MSVKGKESNLFITKFNCYLISLFMSGKLFKSNFNLNISGRIVSKVDKESKVNIFNIKNEELIEILLEELPFQTLELIYLYRKPKPDNVVFPLIKKLRAFLPFFFFPRKNPSEFDNFFLEKSTHLKTNYIQLFKFFLNAETVKSMNVIFSDLLFIGSNNFRKIEQFKNSIIMHKFKKNLNFIYNNSATDKIKIIKFLGNIFNSIRHDKRCIYSRSKSHIKIIIEKDSKKKKIFSRASHISPSFIRADKIIVHKFLFFFRNISNINKKYTAESLFFPNIQSDFLKNELHFIFFKYQNDFLGEFKNKIFRHNVNKNFPLKDRKLIKKSEYEEVLKNSFSYLFKDLGSNCLFSRGKLNDLTVNWCKNRNLIIRAFNYKKTTWTQRFKDKHSINFNSILGSKSNSTISRYESNIYLSRQINLIKIFKTDLQKKCFNNLNLPLNLKKKSFRKIWSFLDLFSIAISLIFNCKFNEKFFLKFFNKELLLCLNMWISKYDNLEKIYKIFFRMSSNEKFSFLRVTRLCFSQNISFFTFFIKKFLKFDHTNFIPFFRIQLCHIDFCLNFFKEAKKCFVTFNLKNIFSLMVSIGSLPFFYKNFRNLSLDFKDLPKIIKTFGETSFKFYEKKLIQIKFILEILSRGQFHRIDQIQYYFEKSVQDYIGRISKTCFSKYNNIQPMVCKYNKNSILENDTSHDHVMMAFSEFSGTKFIGNIIKELLQGSKSNFRWESFFILFSKISYLTFPILMFLKKFFHSYIQDRDMSLGMNLCSDNDLYLSHYQPIQFFSSTIFASSYENSDHLRDFFCLEGMLDNKLLKGENKIDNRPIFYEIEPKIFSVFTVLNDFFTRKAKFYDLENTGLSYQKFKKKIVKNETAIKMKQQKKNINWSKIIERNVFRKAHESSVAQFRSKIFYITFLFAKFAQYNRIILSNKTLGTEKNQLEKKIRFLFLVFISKYLNKLQQIPFVFSLNSFTDDHN